MSVLRDRCGNYLAGQIFNCPPIEERDVSHLWGTTVLTGYNNPRTLESYTRQLKESLYFINLQSGQAYSLAQWIVPAVPEDPNAFLESVGFHIVRFGLDPLGRPVLLVQHTPSRFVGLRATYAYNKYLRLENGTIAEYAVDPPLKLMVFGPRSFGGAVTLNLALGADPVSFTFTPTLGNTQPRTIKAKYSGNPGDLPAIGRVWAIIGSSQSR